MYIYIHRLKWYYYIHHQLLSDRCSWRRRILIVRLSRILFLSSSSRSFFYIYSSHEFFCVVVYSYTYILYTLYWPLDCQEFYSSQAAQGLDIYILFVFVSLVCLCVFVGVFVWACVCVFVAGFPASRATWRLFVWRHYINEEVFLPTVQGPSILLPF